jgi:hypothetical protein
MAVRMPGSTGRDASDTDSYTRKGCLLQLVLLTFVVLVLLNYLLQSLFP